MITQEKLKIYKKYSGNIDRWASRRRSSEHELMGDQDWFVIDELLQNLELIEKGLSADSFKSEVLEKLENSCDSSITKEILMSLVGKYS